MKAKDLEPLLLALKPFISGRMIEQLKDKGNVGLYLEVPGRNGYILNLTLEQYRQLVYEYKKFEKEQT